MKYYQKHTTFSIFSLPCTIFSSGEYTFVLSDVQYAFFPHVLFLGCPFFVCGTVPMWHFPSCSIVNGSWPIPALLFAPYNSVKRILELREHSLGWEISHVTHNRLPLGFLHVSELKVMNSSILDDVWMYPVRSACECHSRQDTRPHWKVWF